MTPRPARCAEGYSRPHAPRSLPGVLVDGDLRGRPVCLAEPTAAAGVRLWWVRPGRARDAAARARDNLSPAASNRRLNSPSCGVMTQGPRMASNKVADLAANTLMASASSKTGRLSRPRIPSLPFHRSRSRHSKRQAISIPGSSLRTSRSSFGPADRRLM